MTTSVRGILQCKTPQPFFDVTDGIFVNYTWKTDHPSKSAILADGRQHHVYTGIDVWGRNTFGGGGFNCHKVIDSNFLYLVSFPKIQYTTLGPESHQRGEDLLCDFWTGVDVRVFGGGGIQEE